MIYLIVIIAIFFIIKTFLQHRSSNTDTSANSNIFNSPEDQIEDADFEELD